jgi:hypothetical protein
MHRDEGRPGDDAVLDLDQPADADATAAPVRERPRRRLVIVALAVAAGLLVLTRPAATGPAKQATPAPPAPRPLVAVRELGHPIFGATAPWSLFLQAAGALVRIDAAQGRVVTTTLPFVVSGSPVRMVPGPDRVVLRPLDFSPSLVVEDGRPARVWTAGARDGGVSFPGPDLSHLWVQASGQLLQLVAFTGRPAGPEMSLPPDADPETAVPDGTGFVVLHRASGYFLDRPSGFSLITNGVLLGVGPKYWVTGRCDEASSCGLELVIRTTGARRALPTRIPAQPARAPATISPDGATMPFSADSGALGLLDLITGQQRAVQPAVVLRDDAQTTAWSPDGRWLFAVDVLGRLMQVDSRTGRAVDSGLTLPPLTDVVVRP